MVERRGKSLERLVSTLERVLGDTDSVAIEAPKFLPDRTTGEQREHDVVVTINHGHHSVVLAIECKDHNRPVGVPIVEAFHAKCRDTGINQGVIVSTSGFYNTARRKADHLGIKCLDIEEVGQFPWIGISGITTYTTNPISYSWTFFPKEEGIVDNTTMELVNNDGSLIGSEVLNANATNILNQCVNNLEKTEGEVEATVRVRCDDIKLRNKDTGDIVDIDHALVKLTYSITANFSPFQFVKYAERDVVDIATAAVADINIGERTARMIIVYGAEGGDGKVIMQGVAEKAP